MIRLALHSRHTQNDNGVDHAYERPKSVLNNSCSFTYVTELINYSYLILYLFISFYIMFFQDYLFVYFYFVSLCKAEAAAKRV